MEIKPKMNVRALQALGFPLLHITLVPLTYVPSSWCRCGKRLRGFNSPTCVLTGLCCLGKTKRYLNNIFYFRPHRPTSLPKALHLTPDLKIFHEAMRQQSSGLSRGLHSALDFIQTPSSTQENTHFEKKIVFIGTHLNIRYTWCWLARTVCTFDIDGAKTKTVTGHDGERCSRTKTWFWRGK